MDLDLLKLALRRDPNVPIGTPSPLHIVCPCVRIVLPIQDDQNVDCPNCGRTYDSLGWVVKQAVR